MTDDASLPEWVTEAARLPVAFAQVREDALLDLSLLDRIDRGPLDVIMIASGGCTAAALAGSGRLRTLHLVDVNPAQMALCRLKIHLLQTALPLRRLQILGHAPMPDDREKALAEIWESSDLPQDVLGPPDVIAQLGPDYAGRYESLFARLRQEMSGFATRWSELFSCDDPSARAAAVSADTPLGQALDVAFDRTMALPHLIRLFGTAATQNSAQPFSRHFAERTRHAIAALAPASNPYLWQLLVGRFPERVTYPWLSASAPAHMPEITHSIGTFDQALRLHADPCDLVHLSNILDWLSPAEARQTLELAHQSLRSGGLVFIRQLNSTLNIAQLFDGFDWLTEDAAALQAADRSFFYARLHLGRKR